ncbi:MAG: sensor domain-containing diguanylate cyclase [Candidatus Omnitrophica bacterium]|nr:MAG: Response regulator PleD [Candidatus Hinthialibacteria bacterium OLB16]MBE7487637.1 sensor domain-containing diguanylate cyclase [bacterium]MBW7938143.1 sensor domain-containing diguanylate cyclase [Candidatus Omnitrophota bacterium]MCE7908888.1 sensor domain-containing diguanylate cyclase [Candidatus Omnitrophica bacterium COP1]MBV6482347.1 hypothetical protein [bacterium]
MATSRSGPTQKIISGTTEPHRFDLIDAIEEAVCFLTEEWKIVFTNDRLAEILGGKSSDYLGKDFRSLFPSDRHESLNQAYRYTQEQGQVRIQVGMLAAGKPEPIPVLLRLIRYSDPTAQSASLYAIILDLSELYEALRVQEFLRQRNRELEDMAITCPLTGLYNRRYFDYRLTEEVRRAVRYRHCLGLAMADIDHFKKVNDTHGHLVGDEVLRMVARTIRQTTRFTDIASRYGGEEFAVILPEITSPGTLAAGLRLRMKIQNEQYASSVGIHQITMSVGVTCFDPTQELSNEDEILRRADEALYRAKRQGRNRVILWGHPGD